LDGLVPFALIRALFVDVPFDQKIADLCAAPLGCCQGLQTVQLYYEEVTKIESVRQSFRINFIPQDVDALKDAIHAKHAPNLTHCAAPNLYVYAAGTKTDPIPERTAALGFWRDRTDQHNLRNASPSDCS